MLSLMAAQFGADDPQGAAETYRRILRRTDLTPGERTVADTLYSTQVTRGLAPETVLALTDQIRTRLSSLGPDDIVDFLGLGGLESVRLMNEHAAALAHFLGGDLHRAAVILERALTFSGMAYPLWRIYMLGSLALVRAWQGHSADALGTARTALDAARDFGVEHHQACVLAHLATALVQLDRVQLDKAERTLAEARPRILARPATIAYFDLHGVLEAWLTALREGSTEALELLREPAAAGTEAPVLREGRRALRMRLLVAAGNLAGAEALLGGAPETGELAAARVDLSLAHSDPRTARAVLDAWTPQEDHLRDSVRHLLRTFAVLEAEGDGRAARESLERAVAAAGGDRLCWPFLEVPASLQALRRNPLPDSSWLTTDLVWKAAVAMNPRVGAQDALTEPLTQRELDVLAYLPGRMRNQEIAADMFVSVNTVKTHVASIYRKLGVTERNEAVERATGLGLL
jgi:LuxR family maltose regulon positive regulatory protein